MKMLFFSLTSAENAREDRAFARSAEELILLVAAGKRDALGDLYELTGSAVYGFILPILRNAHDAEDVLHDTYIRVWEASEGYRAIGKPMGWLMQIAKNLALMKLRDKKRSTGYASDELELLLPPHMDSYPEDRMVLEAALASLSPEEAQIVAMHAAGSMKHREIAALLDIPLATALSKYHRALKKLKTIIAEGEHE